MVSGELLDQNVVSAAGERESPQQLELCHTVQHPVHVQTLRGLEREQQLELSNETVVDLLLFLFAQREVADQRRQFGQLLFVEVRREVRVDELDLRQVRTVLEERDEALLSFRVAGVLNGSDVAEAAEEIGR